MTNKDGIRPGRSPPFEVLKLLIISKLSEENKMENTTNTTYTYNFATEDKDVEISGYWADILADMDREEYNNDQKHRRFGRGISLEALDPEDKKLCGIYDFTEEIEAADCWERMKKHLNSTEIEIGESLIRNFGSKILVSNELRMPVSVLYSHVYRMRKKLKAVRLDMEGFCPDKEATGRKMRKIRKANFLTVEDMRDLLDVKNISTIYRWENGKSLPDEDRLELFCLMFDLDPETFVVMKKKTDEICTKV